jgi:hypothetical protein
MKSYRVSVFDLGDNARWLECADFTRRPVPPELTADKLPKLNRKSGGRFEVRISVVNGNTEYHLYGWRETRQAT